MFSGRLRTNSWPSGLKICGSPKRHTDFRWHPDPHMATGSPMASSTMSTVPESERSPRSSAGNPGPRGPHGGAALRSGSGRQGRPAASSHLHQVTGTHQSGQPPVPALSDPLRPAQPSPCPPSPFRVRCAVVLPHLKVTGSSHCFTQSPVLGTGSSLLPASSLDTDHLTSKHRRLRWTMQRKKYGSHPCLQLSSVASPKNLPSRQTRMRAAWLFPQAAAAFCPHKSSPRCHLWPLPSSSFQPVFLCVS